MKNNDQRENNKKKIEKIKCTLGNFRQKDNNNILLM